MHAALIILFFVLPVLLLFLLMWIMGTKPNISGVVLPFRATVKGSYRLAWKYRMEFLKISWCWLALAVPVMLLYSWFAWPVMDICLDTHQRVKELKMHETMSFIFSSLQDVLMLLFGVSIAVAWHRLILRDEKIADKPYLRFDGVVWDYFILGIIIYFISQLPGLAFVIIDANGSDMLFSKGAISLLVGIPSALYATRITVLLPAKALGLEKITIQDARERTRGNFWRLFWGQFVCMLPGVPPAFLTFLGCGSNIGGPVFYTLSIVLSMMFFTPVYLSFLSLSYQYFFERAEAA